MNHARLSFPEAEFILGPAAAPRVKAVLLPFVCCLHCHVIVKATKVEKTAVRQRGEVGRLGREN